VQVKSRERRGGARGGAGYGLGTAQGELRLGLAEKKGKGAQF